MITAQDVAGEALAVRPAPWAAAPMRAHAPAAGFRERILHVVLFIAVLTSCIAFVEPSPHDAFMAVLAVAALIAGVRFERILVIPIVLLLVWNLGGALALIDVIAEEKTVQYTATSVYLAVAAMLFASIFARNTMPRLATMRSAYILSAVFAALFGLAFYVLRPDNEVFLWAGRVRSTFKDPNVFGPFLILPALFLLDSMVSHKIRLLHVLALLSILGGLLFSFSRGAWIHFTLSATIMLALIILTAPTMRDRMRAIMFGAAAITAAVLAIGALMSIPSVREMLLLRAQLVQSYDVGDGGRFVLQELAFKQLFDHPLGLGPFEFARLFHLQQHNMYLQGFLVYGWLGGIVYIALVLATLIVGLRMAVVRTPWQHYLIAAYATFVGIAGESIIIDSDHWRHFFLVLGIVWGLSAATTRFMRGAPNNGAMA